MQKSIINRRTKRVLAFLIINIFMLISLVINDKNSVLAAENNYVSIEKVYSEVDLNDDFDGTSVIVVLNRKISGINKVHDNLFKDVEYTAIED